VTKTPRGNPWTWIEEPVTRFENPWMRIETRKGIGPAGQTADYGFIRMQKMAVGVLPIFDDGTIALVGQWRVPFEEWSWEIPEGGIERSEDPLKAALRELEEEAGVVPGEVRPLLSLQLSNSITDEVANVWIAWDLKPGQTAPDDSEVLEIERRPFLSVLDDISAGRIKDAITVAAVLRAHHMAISGELPPNLARAMLQSLRFG
jgi:8-oxo-dGTP pyrophosphatase MutT (NUDIX family)